MLSEREILLCNVKCAEAHGSERIFHYNSTNDYGIIKAVLIWLNLNLAIKETSYRYNAGAEKLLCEISIPTAFNTTKGILQFIADNYSMHCKTVQCLTMDRRGQKCLMRAARMGAESVFMEKLWKTESFRFIGAA